MYGKSSPLRSWLLQVSTVSLLISAMGVQAAPPAWWTAGSPPVVNSSPENNKGMANVGQAKWMAQSALEALEDVLGPNSPVVQGIKTDLLKPTADSPTGVFFPERPASPSTEWLATQKAPLRIGALKALAEPFYRHLSGFDSVWLEDQLEENGLVAGESYFTDAGGTLYPWDPAKDNDSETNHGVANIGQLKVIFSLRFETISFTPPADPDGDGLATTEEIALGTNPEQADTDGDGLPDGWEAKWGLNALSAADATIDFDKDGIMNARELELGTSPTGFYRVETIALQTTVNEELAGVGPDGSLVLRREGQVQDPSSNVLGTGFTSDWLSAASATLTRSRIALPYGDWVNTSPAQTGASVSYPGIAGSVFMQRSAVGTTPTSSDYHFLTRLPIAGTQDSKTWAEIALDLYTDEWTDTQLTGAPVLGPVSAGGELWTVDAGDKWLVLEPDGDCVGELPKSEEEFLEIESIEWLSINAYGVAIGKAQPGNQLVTWHGGYLDEGYLITGAVPTAWGSDPWEFASNLTDEDLIVVNRTVTLPGSGTTVVSYLTTSNWGFFTEITGLPNNVPTGGSQKTTAIAGTAIMAGTGKRAWTLIDGRPFALETLQIPGATSNDPKRQIKDLGWDTFEPVHITADGKITAIIVNDSVPAIVQIHPSPDVDGDGLDDGFEYDFAQQLLTLDKTPAEWGSLYAGIQSGNLDAGAVYTTDGLTMGQIGNASKLAPFNGFRVETQWRMSNTHLGRMSETTVTIDDETTVTVGGQAMHGYGNGADSTPMSEGLNPTANWFITQTEGRFWSESEMNAMLPTNPLGPVKVHHKHEEEGRDLEGGGTEDIQYWSGHYEQRKYRIWAKSLDNKPAKFTYLKLTELTLNTWDLTPRTTISSEIVTFNIPAGATCSNWIEVIPGLDSSATQGYMITLLPIAMHDLSFSGAGTYQELRPDDGSSPYSAPHWKDSDNDLATENDPKTGERNYPVAFARNTSPSIGGTFSVTGLSATETVKVKASISGGATLAETPITVNGDGNRILAPTPISRPAGAPGLANTIQFYNAKGTNSFNITWEIKIGSGAWSTLGTTKHTVYVTLGGPIKTAKTSTQESIYNIGCRNAAGQTTAAGTISAIYSDFEDKKVEKAVKGTGNRMSDGMKYWGNPFNSGIDTAQLLAKSDGRCGGWAMMFIDILRSHGIDSQLIETKPIATAALATKLQADYLAAAGSPLPPGTPVQPMFYVKHWSFPANPFVVTPLMGTGGQSNTNPISEFTNHALVMYDGKYYDPSYGSPRRDTKIEWEDNALDGFGAKVRINAVEGLWLWKADTKGTLECDYLPWKY